MNRLVQSLVRQPKRVCTLLKSSRSHERYVFVAVLVLLPLLAGIAFQKELYALDPMRFRGPELEREFGFTAEKG